MDGSSFFASFKAASSTSKEVFQFSGAIDSFPINGNEVVIVPSSGDHAMGSSKLEISNIVNFGWDFQYSPGQLVALHKSGMHFAYGLVSPGRNTGMVRVVQKKTDQRVLLKGMKGIVKDLAFSHCLDKIILGIVDEFGNLYVFRILENGSSDELQTELLLQINSNLKNPQEHQIHRLLWCPYLPEEGDEEDATSARLLVLTHGSIAEMWNIDMILNDHKPGSILESSKIQNGKLMLNDHNDAIMDASFSPDGTALATASADGQVKFFQVYMYANESPRCIHQWKPHEENPVSSLFFLDNHKDHNPEDQFWKFALTGSSNNTEIKLWSCEHWTCLQTVQIKPNDGKRTELKAELDLTAQYLLLSDIHRKNVYVLQLEISNDKVRFVSVSEFATPSPFLSMAMIEAGVRKVADKLTLCEDDSDDDSDSEADPQTTSREATVINFLLVQPKSLQECRIVYDDAFSQPAQPIKKEPTSDTPTEELKEAADKITLMSPEVFGAASSPPKIKEEPASPIVKEELDLSTEKPKRGAILISGGSSPSREVQDILGDSEAHGGLTADIVITEEDDDDVRSDIETDEDSDELSKMLDQASLNASANVKIKQEPIDPLTNIRIKEEPVEEQPSVMKIKSEQSMMSIKSEPSIMSIKTEPSVPMMNNSQIMSQGDMQMIMSRLADMTALIQTQRAEIQVWREEMKALKREETSNMKTNLEDNNDSLKKIIKTVVSEEMRKVGPMMNASMQDALNKDVHGKVLKADLQLKEAIQKMTMNKAVTESIANSLASSLTPAIHSCFKDALTATLVPAFERSSQNMFVQLSTTFNKGLKEYEGQLKTHVSKQLDPVVKELKDKRAINDLEKKLVNTIRREFKDSNSRAEASPNVSISGTSTVQPTLAEMKSHVSLKLSEGKVNEAFGYALNANNLAIVVATCEMVNPNQIFNQHPCPLSQEVLLSLIQQLGHNLESNTDLKLRYLEEAITNLDTDNPSTRQHIPIVTSSVHKQLTNFARTNPNKKIKMLLMATQSLKSSIAE